MNGDRSYNKCSLCGEGFCHTYIGSVLYVCTKLEADSSFRSKVIRGNQNFEIRACYQAMPI